MHTSDEEGPASTGRDTTLDGFSISAVSTKETHS